MLLLGSFPGEESLARGQYYANPRNQFWTLLFAVLNETLPDTYQARLARLAARGVALCDVLETCRRKGSLDSAIKDARPNREVAAFLKAHPAIKVYCTSRKAHALFLRHFGTFGGFSAALASPSPAYASVKFAQKARQWRALLSGVLGN